LSHLPPRSPAVHTPFVQPVYLEGKSCSMALLQLSMQRLLASTAPGVAGGHNNPVVAVACGGTQSMACCHLLLTATQSLLIHASQHSYNMRYVSSVHGLQVQQHACCPSFSSSCGAAMQLYLAMTVMTTSNPSTRGSQHRTSTPRSKTTSRAMMCSYT
jgi:hypothetical protein